MATRSDEVRPVVERQDELGTFSAPKEPLKSQQKGICA